MSDFTIDSFRLFQMSYSLRKIDEKIKGKPDIFKLNKTVLTGVYM